MRTFIVYIERGADRYYVAYVQPPPSEDPCGEVVHYTEPNERQHACAVTPWELPGILVEVSNSMFASERVCIEER